VLVPARALVSNDVTDPLVLTLSSETPHALFAGRTGSGKSHALVATVSDWAERFSPAEFTFIGIDFKGGATLRQLERFPHHRGTVTDLEPSEVPRVLCAIAAEMRRREEELRRLEISSIDVARGIPRLAIVVDEVHEFLRQFPNAHDVLGDVARRGRSLGVHLVVAVQHPTGVLRDSVLGNIPVRVCLAMNTSHDVMAVLGQSTTLTPSPGGALVTMGDGRVREVRIPAVAVPAGGDGTPRASTDTLWQIALRDPVARDGRDGFGLLDDVPRARHTPADWSPHDGDVAVIGEAGSGRTAALLALTRGLGVTWVREPHHLAEAQGIAAIDNLDRILDSLTVTAASDFLSAIARARRQSVRVLVTATSLIRGLDPFRDILTLRRATLDDHRATGAPVDTFDPAARPGVGTWRGLRVVLYASTESMVTASMP
jgi:S-DNA-T family DNA segregation ATPase FtsK/SpoIIIE